MHKYALSPKCKQKTDTDITMKNNNQVAMLHEYTHTHTCIHNCFSLHIPAQAHEAHQSWSLEISVAPFGLVLFYSLQAVHTQYPRVHYHVLHLAVLLSDACDVRQIDWEREELWRFRRTSTESFCGNGLLRRRSLYILERGLVSIGKLTYQTICTSNNAINC